ncbi:MAG: T9SS type A sorting domain-containing protein [Calditrichaeota bacterium]|nr:T9SS type A sorting domain-containing protein [Calditrichota bacterium]
MKLLQQLTLVGCMLIAVFGAYAQAPDTVDVEPGFNTLIDAVKANTGKVFRLKRGGVYVIDAEVKPEGTATFILIGEETPADMPPAVVQRFTLPGGATWKRAIQIKSDGVIENIAFVGRTPNDEQYNYFIRMDSTGTHLTVNNCYFQGIRSYIIGLRKDFISLDFKNNLVLGIGDPADWQNGYVFAAGGVDPGLISMVNNTFMFYGSVLEYNAAAKIDKIIFDHNTLAYLNREWFYVDPVVNRQYTNNIFFNVAMRGFVGPRPSWGYDAGDFSDDTDGDSLVGFVSVDTLGTWIEGIVDADREIAFSNNLRFTTKQVLDFQKETTATYMPTMNARTKGMFAAYPKMVAENNIFEEDGNVLDPNFVQLPPESALDPYFKMVKGRRNESLREPDWPEDWFWDWDGDRTAILSWPPPINLLPQAPELNAAGSDGYPLGDLNWYGKEVREAWERGEDNPIAGVAANHGSELPVTFTLSQNYPNPFNPTTTIGFQLSKRVDVTLDVFNMIGQKVRTLLSGLQDSGSHRVIWDGRDDLGNFSSSGIYIVVLDIDGKVVSTAKMTYVR